MLNTQSLIEKINTSTDQVGFKEVIEVIENEYLFTPTAFTNGQQSNNANENNGSCKIFAFAQIHELDAQKTLHLFGDFYRVDVLQNSQGDDHQNIRQFIINGWPGIEFTDTALIQK